MQKSIFYYATKELSHDAFIAWSIDNISSNDKVLKDFGTKFLKFLLAIDEPGDFSNIEVLMQFKKIDVLIKCEFNGVKYRLAIENKVESTTTKEQLDKNFEALEKVNNWKDRFVYFKNSIIFEPERSIVEESKFKVYDIIKIHDFMKRYELSKHMIISEYAKYISFIFNSLTAPRDPDNNKKSYYWKNFFSEIIRENFSNVYVTVDRVNGQNIYLRIPHPSENIHLVFTDESLKRSKMKAAIIPYKESNVSFLLLEKIERSGFELRPNDKDQIARIVDYKEIYSDEKDFIMDCYEKFKSI